MLTDQDLKDQASRISQRFPKRAQAISLLALAAVGGGALAVASANRHSAVAQTASEHQQHASDGRGVWNIPRVKETADDPATWTLPLQKYQVTQNETNNILRLAATSVAEQKCAQSFGVTYPLHVPKTWGEASADDTGGPRNGMDVRYGDHDLEKVSKYGYGWPQVAEKTSRVTRNSSEDRDLDATTKLVLYGWEGRYTGQKAAHKSAPRVNGMPVPSHGCNGRAQEQVSGITAGTDTNEDAFNKLEREGWDKTQTDPRVQAVWSKWSACMKKKGFAYKDPWAANDDERWSGNSTSSEQISTAKGDVTCRQQFRVAKTMHEVEVAWQNKLLKDNPEVATKAKAYTQRVTKRTNELLGR
ncbi:hypothetical protein [Streptomyces sp. NPDC048650]|uniref:hypothetical protein n=1 Tax=unclassified Streptomyces TaxID=2593676 RepID=UPI00371780B6